MMGNSGSLLIRYTTLDDHSAKCRVFYLGQVALNVPFPDAGCDAGSARVSHLLTIMSSSPPIPAMAMAKPEDYLRAAVSFRKQRELAVSLKPVSGDKQPSNKKPPASSNKTSKNVGREVIVVDSETECEEMLSVSTGGSRSGDHRATESESSKRTLTKRCVLHGTYCATGP